MGFLQPLALFGLGAAAIPALLHLLQRREPPTVVFPAVRYLHETEQRHSRRLRLRHLLLLLLRTALIVFVVLAAARPVAPLPVGGGHAPSAVALIVDNSLSSGAVADGRPVLDRLREAAQALAAEASGADRLWLLTADGIPRPTTPGDLAAQLDALRPVPVRLDLGEAVRAAAQIVGDAPLPGGVAVVSDLQRTALSPGPSVPVPVRFLPPAPPPPNRYADAVRVLPPVWSPEGVVEAGVGGTGTDAVEVRLDAGDRLLARAVAAPGDRLALRARLPGPGWYAARLTLAPDELREDDTWHLLLRGAPPVPVTVRPGAGRFAAEAVEVLQQAARVGRGGVVSLDDAVARAGASVVFPPVDAARLGSVNRQLAARGVPWRFGPPEDGEWVVQSEVAGLDGARLTRRVRLVGTGAVLATAGGAPWLVRAGDVVLVASRLEEEWTDLPVSAGFVPFLDQLVNRIAAGEVWRVPAVPGGAVRLPEVTDAILTPAGRLPVSREGATNAPVRPGVYPLVGAAGDTVGALEVNYDVRESDLRPADQAMLRAAFGPSASIGDPRAAFAGARRAELSTVFLVLAVLMALGELVVATAGGRVRES